MTRRSRLSLCLVAFLLISFFPVMAGVMSTSGGLSSSSNTSVPLASSSTFSWNPRITCTPLVVRITDITANQTQTASFNASPFSPGITTTVTNGVAKRWLTPGPTPTGWVAPGPPCTVTNSKGTNSLFVEIDGIQRNDLTNEDWSNLYDTTNGGTVHSALTSDTTFNLFDPAIITHYFTSCTSAADPTCYARIHAEIDHDWKSAGYCGTGTFCDNTTLASQTITASTMLDVQGFVYWDPGNLNATWHQFNGWEIHPITAWKLSSSPPPPPPSLTVSFASSPTSPLVGQTVTFSGTVSGGTAPYTFSWDFGDSSTFSSTGSQATHIYNAPGPYSVTLRVTDSASVTGQSSSTVTVTSLGTPDFSVTASSPAITFSSGLSATSTVQANSVNGFAGTVVLSEASSPSTGLIVACSPSSLVLSSGGALGSTCTFSSSAPGTYTVTITGTSGTLIHSVAITVTVTLDKHDFAITANPALLSLDLGVSGTSNITVIAGSVFSRTVFLTLTSSPGLTATINPTSIITSGSALLTVRAPAVGNYTVTVTASTRSGLTHSVTVTVQVVDFAISVSTTYLTVNAGVPRTLTVTITPINGFNGVVALTANPSQGLTATLSPTQITGAGTSTLTISSLLTGNYTLTVTGTNGPLSHATPTVTVKVVDFTISASPSILGPLYAGSPGTVTITVASINGFSGLVTLTSSPSQGLNAAINPSSLTGAGTATLTLNAAAAGNYTVTVTGTSDSLSHQTTTVTVKVVDFALTASPNVVSLNVGDSGTSTVTFTSLNFFTGSIALSSNTSPATGLTITCSPTMLTLSSGGTTTSTCKLSSSSTGSYRVTMTGTSGPLLHTAIIIVNVIDFNIGANPSNLTLNAGTPSTSTITITPVNGFSGPVTLTTKSSPGLFASLSSNNIAGSGASTLTLSATVAGNYAVNITATSGSLSHSVLVTISVVDFSLAANPTGVGFNAGQPGTATLTITGLNGFTGTVNLSTVSSPGLTASLSSTSITGSGTATLTLTAAAAGNYTVTVTGTSGSLTHTTVITVRVGDFSVSVSPTSLTLVQGSTSSFTATFTSVNGFTGTIDLSSALSKSSGLTLSCTSSAVFLSPGGTGSVTCLVTGLSNGNYTVTITGTSGALAHSSSLSVRVRQH